MISHPSLFPHSESAIAQERNIPSKWLSTKAKQRAKGDHCWQLFDYITVRIHPDRLTLAALIQDAWMLELLFVCLFSFGTGSGCWVQQEFKRHLLNV